MRKDVILGMTIGGVMLAVVIVYITVTPSGKHKKHTVDTGGQLADGTGAPDPAGQGVNPDGGNADKRAEKNDGASGNPELASGEPQLLKPGNEEKRDPVWGDKLFPKSTPLIGVTQTPDSTAGANNPSDLGGGGDQTPAPKSPENNAKQGNGIAREGASSSGLGSGVAAPPGTQPSTPGKMHKHRIAKGENFSTIAAAYYGSPNFYPHIQRANPTIDPARLKIGDQINLPDIADVKPAEKATEKSAVGEARTASHHREPTFDPKTEYLVQNSDSLYRISMKLYGNAEMVDKIYALNKTLIGDNPAKLKLWTVLKLPSEPSVKEPVAKQ